MPYTVTQMARALSLSAGTIRTWTAEFADSLSPFATVEKGETRTYTEEDLAVFQTVKVLRDQQQSYEAIRERLQTGERLEPLESGQATGKPQEPTVTAAGGPSSLATADILERFIVRYEAKIDHLEGQLTAEREARLTAEKEAARLAGKLEALEAARSSPIGEKGQEGGEGKRPGWWDRLRGKG